MIVYEVNLRVRRTIEREYRAWLDGHMREILALPGFVKAELFEVTDPAPSPEEVSLCTRYHLRDEPALLVYFREHAPRLRAEGVERFGKNFRADRRVMTALT